MAPKSEKTVRLYPVPGQFVVGIPAVIQDVDPATAKELLAWGGKHNPAFTTTPPLMTVGEAGPETFAVLRSTTSPPGEGAEQSTEPAGQAGSSDSTEV